MLEPYTAPTSWAGVTIVATIHSPTAYVYSLFDSLLMLVSVLWCGEVGKGPAEAKASIAAEQ